MVSGDVFSCHAVDNPDIISEIKMLQNYGPSVPNDVIKKLVYLFSDLRNLADKDQINYPYSTREIVNIVKHLEVNLVIKIDMGKSVIIKQFKLCMSNVKETVLMMISRVTIPCLINCDIITICF